ncbi:MAG: sugar phosphate nucleotidyltransferase [Kiritimatiellaeota bacterium]|nr:sugar phosphate nucleotidyltransferase [Kiritimatiellota bacterium]
MNVYAIIMAGGRGERFWPLSRASRPKQFVSLFGGTPLITQAAQRLDGFLPPENIIVITSADLMEQTRAALPALPPENIIGEPFGRDTAAACATATALVERRGGEGAVAIILTADQIIGDVPVFQQTLRDASEIAAKSEAIAVIGVKPNHPATGYGYIECSGVAAQRLADHRSAATLLADDTSAATTFSRVLRFVEKPSLETAKEYVASGRFYWNSGMFVWSARTLKNALREFRPQLLETYERLLPAFGAPGFDAALLAEYNRLEKISIDYAVMEHHRDIVMARCEFAWDDVGTWASAADHIGYDASGNAVHGLAELLRASGNTVVNTENGHLLALMDADDLVVVHTKDATLVCPKKSSQKLKDLVQQIGKNPANKTFT